MYYLFISLSHFRKQAVPLVVVSQTDLFLSVYYFCFWPTTDQLTELTVVYVADLRWYSWPRNVHNLFITLYESMHKKNIILCNWTQFVAAKWLEFA